MTLKSNLFRPLLRLCAVLLATSLATSTIYAADTVIYKSIAADGSVVFTDEPSKGAETVTSTPLNIVTPQETKTTNRSNSSSNAEEALKEATVRFVKLLNPINDQTFVNPRGSINVSLTTGHKKGLPLGHKVQVLLNGAVASTSASLHHQIPVPHRGTHTISAKVYGPSGSLSARSRSVTINILKSNAGGGN